MYERGEGVRQDQTKASELYKLACDAKEAAGCSNLGLMYSKGNGVKLDKRLALEFYGKACDLRDNRGCESYANLKKALGD